TFTDIVAVPPDREILTRKLLSENPEQYRDAAVEGIKRILNVAPGGMVPVEQIECVKMGTTVATNALLERKGERTVLVTTAGFRDALRIAYQNRPRLSDRHVVLPEMLYESVIEVDGRLDAQGKILKAPDLAALRTQLVAAYEQGVRAIAVVLMHAWIRGDHEVLVAQLARDIG